MISTDLAYRLRQQGFRLDPDFEEYKNSKVKEIAEEMFDLYVRLDLLDYELKKIYEQEKNNESF